jgi:hypothetical protein
MISFSRIAAVFAVLMLFIPIIAVAILGTQSVGTQITHGNMVQHQHGIILSKSDVDSSLTFKTDGGLVMHLACSERCLTELGHMQRHIYEHAPTDVYYQQEDDALLAIDVD